MQSLQTFRIQQVLPVSILGNSTGNARCREEKNNQINREISWSSVWTRGAFAGAKGSSGSRRSTEKDTVLLVLKLL